VIKLCRKSLASYKKPKTVDFVRSIPKNPLGKVLKRVLREEGH
jgi:long-chain acyl-CoA synthetase